MLAMLLALPMIASGDTSAPPPPGAMSNGAFLRKHLTDESAKNCSTPEYARMVYKELAASPTRNQFCQCAYSDYYSKFSDQEIVRKLEEMKTSALRLRNGTPLSEREKQDSRLRSQKDAQSLRQSEAVCMRKLNVTVTLSPLPFAE